MKLNLRKSSALQESLKQFITQNMPTSDVRINQYEDVNSQLQKAETLFTEQTNSFFLFSDILYEIRKKVSTANQISGINDILTNVALIDKKIQFLSRLINSGEMISSEVLTGKLEKLKTRDESSYYSDSNDNVITSIISSEKMLEFTETLKFLKKEKQSLQDKLLELNISNYIELSDEIVSILQKESLI
jgi:hypothetical protein